MSEQFDDLFKAQTEKPTFDKALWSAQKKAEKQELFDLIDTTSNATMKNGYMIQSFFDIQLTANTSTGNTFLLLAQAPQSTELGDYSYWHARGASIKKGAKSIKLFEVDGEYRDKHEKTRQNYTVKNFFDISQTTAKRKEPHIQDIPIRVLLKELMNCCPSKFLPDTDNLLPDGLGARYIPETQTILIRYGMSGDDLFRTIGAEIAHAEIDRREVGYNRVEKSFDAFCVSYILCKRNGIDVTGYSFDTIPHSFETSDTKIFKKNLGDISRLAREINFKLQKNLDKNQFQTTQPDVRCGDGEVQ